MATRRYGFLVAALFALASARVQGQADRPVSAADGVRGSSALIFEAGPVFGRDGGSMPMGVKFEFGARTFAPAVGIRFAGGGDGPPGLFTAGASKYFPLGDAPDRLFAGASVALFDIVTPALGVHGGIRWPIHDSFELRGQLQTFAPGPWFGMDIGFGVRSRAGR